MSAPHARLALALLLGAGLAAAAPRPAAAAPRPKGARKGAPEARGPRLPSTLLGVRQMDKRFVPADLKVDLSALPESEVKALAEIVRAAKVMDGLFLRQVWGGSASLLLDLVDRGDWRSVGQVLLFKGPWDRLEENRPFLSGAPPKPPQATFYPADATKAEIEAWLKTLPEAERARATGFFTVVRRAPTAPGGGPGKLTLVPYAIEYAPELSLAAQHLEAAAALTRAPTLKAFLEKRARAFRTNDYYDSDVAWMELDAAVEPTIGPYEVYEDEWFNWKAAFEAFVCVRDDGETKKLEKFSAELQEIENHLPIDPALRNPKIGALAPIRVVNQLFASGDASHGVQTAAFNLPNDERVIQEKGSKRVMLKNVQEAKFYGVLLPLADELLTPEAAKDVDFEPFFTHILMHELVHGLGPHDTTVAGKRTTVRQAMEELYSAVEEAKADVGGLFALQHLIDKGVLPRALERTLYPTYLASMFRSIRFGVTEAHGRANAMQLNALLDAGAFVVKDGRWDVDRAKIKGAVRDLAGRLLTLEGHGDKAGAKALLDALGVLRPETRATLDRVQGLPVDIAPRFFTAEQLLAAPAR